MTVAAAKLPLRTGGSTMGATVSFPSATASARTARVPSPVHPLPQHPTPRPLHDSGTKQTRKRHGFYMVSTWFSRPSSCTTPAHTSACAAGKNIVSPQRSGSAERTHRLPSCRLRSSALGPCGLEHHLRGCVPCVPSCLFAITKPTHHPRSSACICGSNPTSADPRNEPTLPLRREFGPYSVALARSTAAGARGYNRS